MTANQNMSNNFDKKNIIPTASGSVSSTIRQRILDITRSLIGTPVFKKKRGKKATRLLKVDPTEIKTTPISLLKSGKEMKRVSVWDVSSLARNEAGDKKLKKASGYICADCSCTSARNQFGEVEPLQQCTGKCGILLHSSCLAIKCRGTSIARGSRWFCQDCKTCSAIPACPVTESKYLLNCDTCDRGYHLQCLQPPAASDKPKSVWRCSFCLDNPDTIVSAIEVEPFGELEGRKKTSLETQSLISNIRKRKNPNTVKNEKTNELNSGVKLNSKHEKKKQKIELGYWAVRLDRMPNENVPNNLISNTLKRKNPNNAENENTNKLDNGDELNIKYVEKKQKIELGYLTVRLDLMPYENLANSYDKINFIQIEADSVFNAICLNRPNITPSLIETEILKHSSERKALLVKADSNYIETNPSLLHTAGRKRKMIPPDASDKKFNKGSTTSINVEPFGELEDRKKLNLKAQRSNRGRSPEIKEQNAELGIPSSSMNRRDDPKNVLENMNGPVVSGVVHDDVEICKETKKPAKNSKIQAPVRCPATIQFGEFEVETWYSCQFPEEQAPKLYFCEFCLKFSKSKSVLERHTRCCNWRQPPGIEIYRNGDLSVFEVDGHTNKIYCQTLCRIGKLFLDHKTLYYGVEPFLFYVLTKNDGFGCHLVGYFSKEKENEEHCNVACILAMPQYQRQGYGRFLIEFSYLLSKTEKQPGTPEKPLSGLGQLSYNAYWKGVILEYLDNHRNSENLCINDISNETGLTGHDITNTFKSLNMVVEVFNDITICIDWSIVDAHLKRKKKIKKIHIKPDCLSWTPANLSFSSDGKVSFS
ncbi:histone acetyltransferase KAT6B-like isoform X2 [Myzus persicae]|uniref:histone acetyltransferase KAT6B-like isoform X2 n=1 Tax=Myzus persicae TaxID=13164 RepID=UPI000B939161|nr:histone acetyltransferase KAT6B-like isoform X2 [Myzus persicae]